MSEIARKLGRCKSTISRELQRGKVLQRRSDLSETEAYFAETGQAVYEKRRKYSKNSRKIGKAHEFIVYAEEKILKDKWSPDAVVGFAKTQAKWDGKPIVCTKTLYNYIDLRLMRVRNIDLPLKVRLKPKNKWIRKAKRRLGRSIDERPRAVENRQEFGHWEIDSVIGCNHVKTAVMTLVERKTRMLLALKLDGRGAEAVNKRVGEILGK